ncbi:hypothetical protein MAPG_02639 [Magnaporthiopsis poae ATCC 64411]|uniref:Nucleoside phosphorylase domain-containing protein n=1 Tax=Magnaporthiopsis poae (strain ATCC 64411 / 73-15) TaxID=644358 RepID=A0A0C4DRX1_MAGP6|nr:hypothetical protein MAPG_02639 [Magnaporthiopsis poae ATCC 64411]
MLPPTDRNGFNIAIICALRFESDAVSLLFDDIYEKEYGKETGDTNTYTTGRIGNHAVVLLLLPNMGMQASAAGAKSLHSSYTNIKLAMLVGICGGLPQIRGRDAFLGDVVVSTSILSYLVGKKYPAEFVVETTKSTLTQSDVDVRGLLELLGPQGSLDHLQGQARAELVALQAAALEKKRNTNYSTPPDAADIMFPAEYGHIHYKEACDDCHADPPRPCEGASKLSCQDAGCETSRWASKRNRHPAELVPRVFMGKMACGNTVMKSGTQRDEVAKKYGVIAFEVEGAEVRQGVPFIVVKGICDYADGHKNKEWQNFAAATAASVAAAILDSYEVPGGAMEGVSEGRGPNSGGRNSDKVDSRGVTSIDNISHDTAHDVLGGISRGTQYLGTNIHPKKPKSSGDEMGGFQESCGVAGDLHTWAIDALGSGGDRRRQFGLPRAMFDIDFGEFIAVMNNEYPHDQKIRKVLTLTGAPDDAFANSAKRYAKFMWGSRGPDILDLIESLAAIVDCPARSSLDVPDLGVPALGLPSFYCSEGTIQPVERECGNGMVRAWVGGTPKFIADAALQFAWVMSAFRRPYRRASAKGQDEPVLAISAPEVRYGGREDGEVTSTHHFVFRLQDLKPCPEDTASGCWHDIFCTYVLARGFPIPARPAGLRGAELPFALMTTLSAVDYSLPFLNGFVLKGRRAALVPPLGPIGEPGLSVEDKTGSPSGRCIQWHLVLAKDGDLTMDHVYKQVTGNEPPTAELFTPSRTGPAVSDKSDQEAETLLSGDGASEGQEGQDLDPDHFPNEGSLASTKNRHFLGLYRSANVHIGTRDSLGHFLQSPEAQHMPKHMRLTWAGTLNMGVGFSLLGLISLSLSTTTQLNRAGDGSNVIKPLVDRAEDACTRLAILYDTNRKTGWLLSEAAVVLHLMQDRIQKNRCAYPPPYAFPDGPLNNLESISRALQVFVDHSARNGNLFKYFDDRCCQMRETVYTPGGFPLSFHSFTSSKYLTGISFCELAAMKDCGTMRVPVSSTSGQWVRMLHANRRSPSKQVLVFFCGHIDNGHMPIRRGPGIETCSTWNVAPGDRSYLVAMASCVHGLLDNNHQTLVSDNPRYYWGPSQHPFTCVGGVGSFCDRLQRLTRQEPNPPWNPREIPGEGAVVFGEPDGTNIPACQQVPAA